MKKQITLFVLLLTLFIACKSEEQKQYDELIDNAEALYEKIKDKPAYLYSSERHMDGNYLAILDEQSRILYKAAAIRENSKIDDRPTTSQQKELIENIEKIQAVLNNE